MSQVNQQESLAHITQTEAEAVREYDRAIERIEAFVSRPPLQPKEVKETPPGSAPPKVLKKQRVIAPSSLVASAYHETTADVDAFLAKLREELEQAIANNERIQIR